MVVLALTYVADATARVSSFPSVGNFIEYLAGIATVISALFMYFQARSERRKQAMKRREDILQLQTDFYGDRREGVPPRPGVLEMLDKLTITVDGIAAEVNYNHGGSIKDAVDRIDSTVGNMQTDIRGIHDRLDAKEG